MLNKTVFIFIISLIIYLFIGINAPLQRDPGIYVYSAQRVADGIPPYKSIFDHKGPGAPLLLGGILKVYRFFSDSPLGEIRFLRLVTILLISLIPVAIFFLTLELFKEDAAFLSALSFLTFLGFSLYASAGPRPKSFMLLFEVLFLYFMIKRKYFWAGFFISAATLIWQPLASFAIAGLYISLKEKKSRMYLWGMSILPAFTLGYFLYHRAFRFLWEGAVVFNLRYVDTNPLIVNLERIRIGLLNSYNNSFPLILLGILSFFLLFSKKETPRILLYTFPLPIIWSLVDYQGGPDFYPILPFVCIGLGYLINKFELKKVELYLLTASLILISIIPLRRWKISLKTQHQEVVSILKRYDGKVITIGAPHFMALAGIKNPSRYVFVIRGIDKKIEKEYRGGIKGWLSFLLRRKPCVIVFGQTNGRHSPEIRRWLNKNFQRWRRTGYFKIYLKK